MNTLGSIVTRVFGNKSAEPHAMTQQPHQLYKSVGRNDPCPCGSGIKYKKCCLAATTATAASVITPKPTSTRQYVGTMTGEVFIPIRLYYKINDKIGVETAFRKLECMDYDPANDRWTWLFDNEAKHLKFEKSYSSIPVHRRPIILGSFYSRVDTEMYIDVGSVDRAVKAVEFFDKHIDRSVAEVTYFAIYNKITSDEAEKPGPCFDSLFSDVRTDLIDQKMEANITRISEAVKAGQFLDIVNERKFELVEAHHVNYYAEGVVQLKTSLELREAVAVARWNGNPDYCMNDLIKAAIFKTQPTNIS